MKSRVFAAERGRSGRRASSGFPLLAPALGAVSCFSTGDEGSTSTTTTARAKGTTPSTPAQAPRTTTTTASTTPTPPPATPGAVVPNGAEFPIGHKATYEDGSSVQIVRYGQPPVTDSILKPPARKGPASVDI